jgi:hypothetical protein
MAKKNFSFDQKNIGNKFQVKEQKNHEKRELLSKLKAPKNDCWFSDLSMFRVSSTMVGLIGVEKWQINI